MSFGEVFSPVPLRGTVYLPMFCGRVFTTVLLREFSPVLLRSIYPWRGIYPCYLCFVEGHLSMYCGGIFPPVLWIGIYPCYVEGNLPLSCGGIFTPAL